MNFVAQKPSIIRKLFIFSFFINNAKTFLLELVVIINESWYYQAYIFVIIELWSPISTFFHEQFPDRKLPYSQIDNIGRHRKIIFFYFILLK